jgi:glycosyltransferase involved in cell wall biosynthesis
MSCKNRPSPSLLIVMATGLFDRATPSAGRNRPLRVGIDARPLAERPCGFRRYLENLLPALLEADENVCLELFAHHESARFLTDSPRVEFHLIRGPRQTLVRPIWDRWQLPPHLRRAAPDLFFSTYGSVPGGTGIPTVISIQDLAFLKRPDLLPLRYRPVWKWLSRRWPRARACLVPSVATRDDVLALTGIEPNRIEVVHHGVDPRFRPSSEEQTARVRRRFALTGPFALWVGTREPRKNLEFLIGVFDGLNTGRAEPVPLVLVGGAGWGDRSSVASRSPWISVLEGVDDETLVALYGAASIFVFPSLDEGFGLPVIEAMACGTAVVAARAGSLPEVAGSAAELVLPGDLGLWVDTLSRVLSDDDLRHDLERRGLARSRAFSWDRAAEQTLDVFRSALARPV